MELLYLYLLLYVDWLVNLFEWHSEGKVVLPTSRRHMRSRGTYASYT